MPCASRRSRLVPKRRSIHQDAAVKRRIFSYAYFLRRFQKTVAGQRSSAPLLWIVWTKHQLSLPFKLTVEMATALDTLWVVRPDHFSVVETRPMRSRVALSKLLSIAPELDTYHFNPILEGFRQLGIRHRPPTPHSFSVRQWFQDCGLCVCCRCNRRK